jgi:hypothetical protein
MFDFQLKSYVHQLVHILYFNFPPLDNLNILNNYTGKFLIVVKRHIAVLLFYISYCLELIAVVVVVWIDLKIKIDLRV